MAGKKKATPKKTAARGKPKSTTRGRATAASRTKGVRAKPSRAAKPARKPRLKPAAKPKVGPILDAKTAHAALEEQARSLAYVDLIRELDATGSKSETATWRDVLLTEIERRKKDEPKPAKVTRARAKDEEE
jgi:hypothetical protein